MIVVSDTGPLNYLLWIDAIDLLPQLYGSVIIPEAVRQELAHTNAPERVRQWAAALPEWVSVRTPAALLTLPLDIGEQEAISLAVEIDADLLLIDDRPGREVAEAQALIVTGTLGVLVLAAQHGLLDLEQALDRLRQTNFRVTPALLQASRERLRDETNENNS